MSMMADVCPDARLTKCKEGGCHVPMPKSFVAYCGEAVRDQIRVKGEPAMKMFDCIITDSREDKMSAVELKHRRGGKGVLKGKRKAGRIEDVRGQFTDGLIVLRKILERMAKPRICIQLVLYTKTEINDRSELAELRKPLHHVSQRLRITPAVCGGELPEGHVAISVRDLSA